MFTEEETDTDDDESENSDLYRNQSDFNHLLPRRRN